MKFAQPKRQSWIRAGAIASLALVFATSTTKTGYAQSNQLPPWERLEFKASKLMITARSSLSAAVEPIHQAEAQWHPLSEGHHQLQQDHPQVVRLTTETSVLGRSSTTTVWLNGASLAAHQRTLVESGSRARKKIYRFHAAGAQAYRSEPADSSERDLPEPRWTRRSEQAIATPTDATITDPLALFYLIATKSHAELDRGIEVAVLTRNAVNRVRVKRLPDPVQVRTQAKIARGSETIVRTNKSSVEARVYQVTPLANASELRLLGLEGALEVFVDESLRLPVEIRGKIPPVGSVTVRLQSAALR